ncbi:MAG: hypothetical protein M1826_007165 [Phylliscum demangeonii]|nr:MAG: hypothetical protein M1826_007165 [Phylliscum demangeonii]
MADDSSSLNVPQLVAFLLISALAVRWFFFTSSSSSSSSSASASSTTSSSTTRSPPSSSSSSPPGTTLVTSPGGRRVHIRERDVEQIQAMFPQYGRREILWDLMRNGGSVAATTERILTAGRRLDAPPTAPSSSSAALSTQPNLIARYHLAAKIAPNAAVDGDGTARREMQARTQTLSDSATGIVGLDARAKATGWSGNKQQRQAMLQRRREAMILDARRSLLAKEIEKEREREREEEGVRAR